MTTRKRRMHWWAYLEAAAFLGACVAVGALGGAAAEAMRLLLGR